MTFEQYVQSLQDQFVRDGGHPDTEDVCKAVAFYSYHRPELPFYRYQNTLVELWFSVNGATDEAKEMAAGKYKFDFLPLVERGNVLMEELLAFWDQVKDLPEVDLREIQKSSPVSSTYKLYDAVCFFSGECRKFDNLVGETLEKTKIITDYQRKIGNNSDVNNKLFTLTALQMAIDKIHEKKARVTKTDLREYFRIKSPATLRKHLNNFNLEEGKLDSAMRGESRLE